MIGAVTVAMIDGAAGLETVGAALVEVLDRQLQADRNPADLLLVAVRSGYGQEACTIIGERLMVTPSAGNGRTDQLATLRAVALAYEAADGPLSLLEIQPLLPPTWAHRFINEKLDELVSAGFLRERVIDGVWHWTPTADGLIHLDAHRND